MSGKVYFITGGNRGIGLELVKILATERSNTVLASARIPTEAAALTELAAKGNVHVIKLDVSSKSSISELDSQLSKFAPDGIDYFISNAGIANMEAFRPALEVPSEVWIDHFTTNTLGPVLITQKVVPFLRKRGTKVVYLVSTLLGSIGQRVEASSSAYGMSKAALNYFARDLASELKDEGFTVVAVHPGLVSTDLVDGFLESTATAGGSSPFESAVITPQESAKKQVELLGTLDDQNQSSKFFSYTGEEVSW